MSGAKPRRFDGHILVVLILMLGVGQLPPVGALTETGMKGAGIVIGILYGWIFSSTVWTSFLGLLMLAWQAVLPFDEVLAMSFGSKTTMLVLFSFILAAVMEQNQVSRYVGVWLLSRPVLVGRPWAFSLIVLITAFLLGTFVLPVVGVLLCWSLLYHVFEQIGCDKRSPYAQVMVVGVAFAGALSLGGLPWQVVPQVILGAYPSITGASLDYFDYVLFTWPMVALLLAGYILLGKYVFRIDVAPLAAVKTDALFAGQGLVLNRRMTLCLLLLALYIVMMLLPSILPSDWAFTTLFAAIGPSGTLMLLLVLMMWIRLEGVPLLNFQKAAPAIQWEAVILTATAMPISYLMISEETGILDTLLGVAGVVLQGQSLFVVWLLSMLFLGIFSNVFSCLGVLLLPLLCSYAVQLDAQPAMLAVPMLIFANLALLTPAGSPVAALLHSNGKWVDKRIIYKFGGSAILVGYVLVLTLGYVWALIVF